MHSNIFGKLDFRSVSKRMIIHIFDKLKKTKKKLLQNGGPTKPKLHVN